MVNKKAEKVIRNMEDEKVIEMLENINESRFSPDFQREQKKLLDEMGLFDIDLDNFDISDKLRNRILHLKYYNAESDVQPEFSEEVKEKTRERMRELGLEPSGDS